jgi:uncharacterized protein
MRSKLIQSHGEKTFAVVFDKGDEFAASLLTFAQQHALTAAHFTAVGAFSDATLGFFDRERMDYHKIPVPEQTEVLALIGNIALDAEKGEPKVHAHVVLGRSDGTTCGGHILEAHVWPTLEVIVVESPRHLRRTIDKETGLALIDLEGV